MSNRCKYIISCFCAVLLCVAFIPAVDVSSAEQSISVKYQAAHAQEGITYEFMQPLGLPGFGGESGEIDISDDSLATYINTLIQVVIGFAILLAVIMVIAGGVEYMGARSVTNKDDAKERINKALMGLILALSAIAILQTINPNLVEIKPLGEVDVEGGGFVDPDFGDISNFTFNPDDTGLYYCFSHDSWGTNDNACAETESKCSDVREADSNSYSQCQRFVYYQGAYDDAENKTACYAYQSSGGDPTNDGPRVRCFNTMSACTQDVEDMTSGISETSISEDDILVSCQPPADFGEGSDNIVNIYRAEGSVVDSDGNNLTSISGLGVPNTDSGVAGTQQAIAACESNAEAWMIQNDECQGGCSINGCNEGVEQTSPSQLLEGYVLNGNPSEQETRQLFANQTPTIYTNRGGESDPTEGGFCEAVTDSECTNVGGLSQEVRNELFELNNDFANSSYCEGDCNLTVTGGTSWWFHGNQEKNPAQTVNGNTCHNPDGISSGLCTRAIDLRKEENLNNYIQNNGQCGALNSGEYLVGDDWFLNEGDHWHITFNRYPNGCESITE